MKKTLLTVLAILMFMMFTASSAMCADAEINVDYNSAYVWRGLTLNDGRVVQPSVDLTNGIFGINVWGSYDVDADDEYGEVLEEKQFSETDYTLYFGFDVGAMDLEAGYIEYTFTNDEPAMREVYTKIGAEVKGLTVTLSGYYEFENIDDYYANLEIKYGCDVVKDKLGIEIGASAGYVGEDYSTEGKEGFNEYNTFLAIALNITDTIAVSANINYTDTIDDEVLADETVDVDTYGGASITYTF